MLHLNFIFLYSGIFPDRYPGFGRFGFCCYFRSAMMNSKHTNITKKTGLGKEGQ